VQLIIRKKINAQEGSPALIKAQGLFELNNNCLQGRSCM